jgi:transcriptional regulator with XRE-family HTH domain
MAKPREALRYRRLQMGFTQEKLAESMGIATTTYREWERGIATPRVGFRPRLAKRLQVTMVEVARMLEGDDRLSAPGAVDAAGWLGAYAALEQGAGHVATFQPFAVPGLLQTATYAAAVERCGPDSTGEGVVARYVDMRLARQEVLAREPDPLRLSVVLDESVLYRIAGDGEIMYDQLQALVDSAGRATMDLRILRLDASDFAVAFGSFVVLTARGASEPYMASVIDAGGAHYLDRPHEVAAHQRLFSHLSTVALSPEASVELIRAVAKECYR